MPHVDRDWKIIITFYWQITADYKVTWRIQKLFSSYMYILVPLVWKVSATHVQYRQSADSPTDFTKFVLPKAFVASPRRYLLPMLMISQLMNTVDITGIILRINKARWLYDYQIKAIMLEFTVMTLLFCSESFVLFHCDYLEDFKDITYPRWSRPRFFRKL